MQAGEGGNATTLASAAVKVSAQQGSWVASLSLLGALFGGACAGTLIRHGRKRTLSCATLPFAASWTLTVFASRVEMIYLTAFLVGFFSAVVQLATQVYIAEIAHPSIRASLCSAAKVLSHVGLLFSYALGAFLDWRRLAAVCAGAPLALAVTSRFVPESPSHLLYTGRDEEAERALIWLRGGSGVFASGTGGRRWRRRAGGAHALNGLDVSAEMEVIRTNICRVKEVKNRHHDCLAKVECCPRPPPSRLVGPLAVTCGLTLFHRFSGASAFNCYAVTIIADATAPGSVDPHLAAVVVGGVQLLASR